MDAHVQSSLSVLEQRLNGLLSSLTISPNAVGAPAAAIALLDADDSVTSSLSTLRQHQQNYSKILRLRAEATRLEERVKSIVRDIEMFDTEIRVVCNDNDDESSSESEFEGADPEDNGGHNGRKRTKEVDYRLLLDFARRISKYNQQAATDEETQEPSKKSKGHDVAMNGDGETTAEAQPVSSVTKNATTWLDESAKQTRQVYMLPYPLEDRISVGLMGQIHRAASEGRPGFDPDKEVERLIREAEGFGASPEAVPAAAPPQSEAMHTDEPTPQLPPESGAMPPPAPSAPKRNVTLDLYDPNDDDDA